MIPSVSTDRRVEYEEKFYNYFSSVSKYFKDPHGFISWLCEDSGFFDLPATVGGTCNYKGGMLEHSVNVTKQLVDINYFIADVKYSLDECIMFGLFHDIDFSIYNGMFPYIYIHEPCGWILNEEISCDIKPCRYNNIKDDVDFDFTILEHLKIMLEFAHKHAVVYETKVDYSICGMELEI